MGHYGTNSENMGQNGTIFQNFENMGQYGNMGHCGRSEIVNYGSRFFII